jgi:hypothetical protein
LDANAAFLANLIFLASVISDSLLVRIARIGQYGGPSYCQLLLVSTERKIKTKTSTANVKTKVLTSTGSRLLEANLLSTKEVA